MAISKINGFEGSDTSEMLSFFEKKLIIHLSGKNNENNESKNLNAIVTRLQKIELLEFHRSIALRQRQSYIKFRENFQDDTLFIEFDFKMKIQIGMSPEQVSYEFYNLKSRYVLGKKVTSCFGLFWNLIIVNIPFFTLGFGIFYKKNGIIESINVDIISDNMGQKGISFINAFRYLNSVELFFNLFVTMMR